MHMDTVMDFGLAEEMIWISVQSEDEPCQYSNRSTNTCNFLCDLKVKVCCDCSTARSTVLGSKPMRVLSLISQ